MSITYTFTNTGTFSRIQLIEDFLKNAAGTIVITFSAFDRRDAFKQDKRYEGVYTYRHSEENALLLDAFLSQLRRDVWNALINSKNVFVDLAVLPL